METDTPSDTPSDTPTSGLPPQIRLGRMSGVDPKHIEQFWGPWAISLDWAANQLHTIERMDLSVHPVEQRSRETEYQTTDDGIAIVEINGMMTKRGSSFASNPGTVELRRQVSLAARDPRVRGIMLSIESPGGTAAGTKEMADAVSQAASQKPVVAYIEDLGASAAYYVASQATSVWANKPALVGSIGTFMVLTDSSKMADDMGVNVLVIKSGDFKGVGTPGTEITEEHVEYYQGLIKQINSEFQSAVKTGRRMSDDSLAAVANGKVFLATEAKSRGLIDQIGTYDQALEEVTNMADQKTPQPASLKELQSALVGADSDFLVDQLGSEATLQQAQEAWIVEQGDRLKAAQAMAAEQKEKAEKAQALQGAGGIDPIGESKAAGGVEFADATAEWGKLINDKVFAGMDRMKAAKQVNKENPGLREAMVAEAT